MDYPDLSNSKIICFDCETKDPDLMTKGPSVHRGGYVLGISIADETGFSEYYNLGHNDCTLEEREKNIKFLTNIFNSKVKKLGMNIIYDLDWIQNFLKIKVNGILNDVLVSEYLINENQFKYNLDFLSEKYLGLHKVKTQIDKFCEFHNLKGDSRNWLWKMPYKMVRDYAKGDVELPLKIFPLQWKILNNENLLGIYHMEMRLYPMLINMRKHGVKINTKKIRILEEQLIDILLEYEFKLNELAGFEMNYNSSASIGKICDKLGLKYPLTKSEKPKPSFTKPWLEINKNTHKLFFLVMECRKYHKIINTFVESQIKNQVVDGNIYSQFHPCKTGGGGTVTGRFSSSNPNLQFIPSPDSDVNLNEPINIGKEIRSLFIPFENHMWGRLDYSQIEIRLTVHYAIGKGSEEVVESFRKNKNLDYHQWCADIAGITRKNSKPINFGIIYGMGVEELSKRLNMSKTDGHEFLDMYFSKLPFLKKTLYAVKNKAERVGFVKTILGRRRRFPNREFTYKALNAVVQGSAADIIKKAMVDSWEAGIYNEIIPLLTVHDELDVSIPKTKVGNEAFKELKNIMEKSVQLKIPVIVNSETGENWGYVK